jgi:hypothetical protein
VPKPDIKATARQRGGNCGGVSGLHAEKSGTSTAPAGDGANASAAAASTASAATAGRNLLSRGQCIGSLLSPIQQPSQEQGRLGDLRSGAGVKRESVFCAEFCKTFKETMPPPLGGVSRCGTPARPKKRNSEMRPFEMAAFSHSPK